MRAVHLVAKHELSIVDVAAPVPGAGEVVIALRAAALNRRDVWMKRGEYAGLRFPCLPGSDGAGVVTAVGAGVSASWIGSEVVINPSFGWGERDEAPGPGFSILGLPRDGTLAEQIAVPVEQVAPKPAHLTWEQAAALPLAGLTAYRALVTRARLRAGERVLITGIGGGVAALGLMLARALGARVWVTSSRPDALAQARAQGAEAGFDYTQPVWIEAAKAVGGFDVILDSAGGETLPSLIEVAAPGARLVSYGATLGNPGSFALRKVFWRQLSLLGTTMGSPRDWAGLLACVTSQRLQPPVGAVYPLEHVSEAFALMEQGAQQGKVVLRIA